MDMKAFLLKLLKKNLGELIMYVEGNHPEKLMIQLAPTGMINSKKENPDLPISPKEIVNDTRTAYKLGASGVHVHAREADGSPSYRLEVYQEILEGIKKKCPDMIICVSTSGRVDQNIKHRSEVLELKPDMASLTLGSVNFQKYPSSSKPEDVKFLAQKIYEHNIKPEIEIFEPGLINMAKYLLLKGYLKPPLHFNLFMGSLGSISADFKDLVYLEGLLPEGSTWGGTGIGRFQFQINTAAILMGGHVRVGLEDAIYYSHQTKELATNKELMQRIVKIAGELGREIASPQEARRILGLMD